MNNFFANTVQTLNTANFENSNSLAENIDDPTLKPIATWRNHPSIQVIVSEYKNISNFYLDFVSKEDVLTEIKIMDVSKAIQERDISVEIIKSNEDFLLQKQFVFTLTNH